MKIKSILTFILFMPVFLFAAPCSWSAGGCTTSVHQHEDHWTLFTSCNYGSTFLYQGEGQHSFPPSVCGNQQ